MQDMQQEESYETVVRRYSAMVYRLALAQVRSRADAEDIFQEVFLRYFRSAPAFADEEHRKAWLLRVTLNCSKKFWTSAWMRHTVPLEEAADFAAEDRSLWEHLQSLPGKYRAVLHLYYYENLTSAEIGALLGLKAAAVRARLMRARRMLKKSLEEESEC